MSTDPIVVLVHGIRTRAAWQGMVRAVLSETANAEVIPLKYGYFDVLKFLCPFGICRSGPIKKLERAMRQIIYDYPDRPLTIIAHSYGTYALTKVLEQDSNIRVHRIILAGSIVPNDYPWNRVASQVTSKPMRSGIINETGTRDFWPPLARSATWGYGDSGTYGFGSPSVTDRSHDMTHSGYFDESFVREFWGPFVSNGTVVGTVVDKAGGSPPRWMRILGWPVRALEALSLVLVVILIAVSSCWPWARTPDSWAKEEARVEDAKLGGSALSPHGFCSKLREDMREKVRQSGTVNDIRLSGVIVGLDDGATQTVQCRFVIRSEPVYSSWPSCVCKRGKGLVGRNDT